MKKKILYFVAFILVASTFSACEENCKNCSLNTYNADGDLILSTKEGEYCGAELIKNENTPDFTDPITGSVVKWVCK